MRHAPLIIALSALLVLKVAKLIRLYRKPVAAHTEKEGTK